MARLNKKSLTTKRLTTGTSINKPQAKMDVLDTSISARKRRQPIIEVQNEDRLMRTYDRLRAINLVRDLERNFSSAKNLINQIRINVVGSGPKIRVHSDDDKFNEWAEGAFSKKFSPNCDFRGDTHFGDMLSLAFGSAVREGDILWVYDDGWIDDTGKVLLFEADQLVEIEDLGNAPAPYNTLNQQSGILFDNWGRVRGYAVTSEHGKTSVKAKDAVFISAENARLLKEEWRPNSKRGQSAMLTAAASLQDAYEISSKELQTMKTLSSFGGVVTKAGINKDLDILGKSEMDAGEQPSDVHYDRLESLTGGMLSYMEPGDKFEPISFDRPSANFREAIEGTIRQAGSALGLTKTYSTMAVESSYTSYRGESIISWGAFYRWQKQLERQVCDWVAHKAINYYATKEGVDVPEYSVSWLFPTMQTPDPLKEAMANTEKLKTFQTTFSEVLGPDWKKIIDQIAEETAYAKGLGLPLDNLYGEAGAIAATRTLKTPNPNDPSQAPSLKQEAVDESINTDGADSKADTGT